MKPIAIAAVMAVGLSAAPAVRADDWPQWRGPNRDGRSAETGLLEEWPQGGPKLLWAADGIGAGWSSPAVAGGLVYVTGVANGVETLRAYDLDGNPRWHEEYGPAWTRNHVGSRYTPTVDDGLIYVLTGTGVLSAYGAASGAKAWTIDIVDRFKPRAPPLWGFAEGLLVAGDNLICTPGARDATLAALDKKSGQTAWTAAILGDEDAYCAPILVAAGDLRLAVTITSRHVVGVDTATGACRWKYFFRNLYGDHPLTPIYHDGRIYAGAGYGMGGVMLKLAGGAAGVAAEWTDSRLDSLHGGVVLVDGYLYGSGDHNPNWVCLDWATGNVMWEDRGIGRGCVTYADGMLYCYSEDGTVALVKPDPKGWQLVSAFRVPKGKGEHWAHPVIAGGRLYIRHGGTLMAYDIAKKVKPQPPAAGAKESPEPAAKEAPSAVPASPTPPAPAARPGAAARVE